MNPGKIFVCPDLHEAPNLDEVEAAIRHEAPSRTVFLGDYFDQFYDTPDDAARTAQWLKGSLAEPNRIHLWGNHDLAYGFPNIQETWCSGFTWEKSQAINAILGPQDWAKLQLFQRCAGFLLTHAGWSDTTPKFPRDMRWLVPEAMEAWRCLTAGKPHWIWGVGRARGGSHPCGGLLWCDVHEFVPIPGINQIFGHTPGNLGTVKEGRDSLNICLDTCRRETGAQHYLLIEGPRVQVKRLDGGVVRSVP